MPTKEPMPAPRGPPIAKPMPAPAAENAAPLTSPPSNFKPASKNGKDFAINSEYNVILLPRLLAMSLKKPAPVLPKSEIIPPKLATLEIMLSFVLLNKLPIPPSVLAMSVTPPWPLANPAIPPAPLAADSMPVKPARLATIFTINGLANSLYISSATVSLKLLYIERVNAFQLPSPLLIICVNPLRNIWSISLMVSSNKRTFSFSASCCCFNNSFCKSSSALILSSVSLSVTLASFNFARAEAKFSNSAIACSVNSIPSFVKPFNLACSKPCLAVAIASFNLASSTLLTASSLEFKTSMFRKVSAVSSTVDFVLSAILSSCA